MISFGFIDEPAHDLLVLAAGGRLYDASKPAQTNAFARRVAHSNFDATTIDEVSQIHEKDPALERPFSSRAG